MSERERLAKELRSCGDAISLIDLKRVLCRNGEWLSYAIKHLGVQKHGTCSARKPSWKTSGLWIATSDALLILDEHLRCSECGMYPGDPTPQEIYEQLAPAIREKEPRLPVWSGAGLPVETSTIPLVMVRAAYRE